ncbi:MarR family transcriptional regulator [soil metagenome]
MSDTLGFLISDVSRLLRRRFDERARLIGATRAQWKTLVTLARHEGMNQGGLAELLEVEPITLCRMIDRLEEAGLVERRRDPSDRRAWQIFLTAKALPLIDKLRAIADEMTEGALEGIDDATRDVLANSLDAIRINLTIPDEQEAKHG